MPYWGLIQRRETWVLSRRGWFLLLALAVASVLLTVWSSGVRTVVGESIAYLYARFVFVESAAQQMRPGPESRFSGATRQSD